MTSAQRIALLAATIIGVATASTEDDIPMVAAGALTALIILAGCACFVYTCCYKNNIFMSNEESDRTTSSTRQNDLQTPLTSQDNKA